MTTEDKLFLMLIVAVGAIFALLLIVRFAVWLKEFSRELRMINIEIQRNTGSERRYWKSKKRRLLLSVIPFVKY